MKVSTFLTGILLLGFSTAWACPDGPPGAKCRAAVVKCPGGGQNAKCLSQVAACKSDSNEDKCHTEVIEKTSAAVCIQDVFDYLGTNSVTLVGGGMGVGGMGTREISLVAGSDLISVVTKGMGGMGMSMDTHVLYAPNGRKITIHENGNCESVTVEKTERNFHISSLVGVALENLSAAKCPGGGANAKCVTAANSIKKDCAPYVMLGGQGGGKTGVR